ncbi:hypothetical protein GPALN_004207 [Globodera pallida]|nr:hypothetical protein GPALN_004207 [Globodera pallida]
MKKQVVKRARRDIEVPLPQPQSLTTLKILPQGVWSHAIKTFHRWDLFVGFSAFPPNPRCHGQTATTYERAFHLLKAVWPNFSPDIVTEALINATCSVFGHVQIDVYDLLHRPPIVERWPNTTSVSARFIEFAFEDVGWPGQYQQPRRIVTWEAYGRFLARTQQSGT